MQNSSLSNKTPEHHILVVDDAIINIQVINQILRSHYRVSFATSGEQALAQMSNNPPELILMDVMMPGLNGFETVEKMKQDEALQHIPVIFLTAMDDTESSERAISLGSIGLITKPVERDQLLNLVQTVLY